MGFETNGAPPVQMVHMMMDAPQIPVMPRIDLEELVLTIAQELDFEAIQEAPVGHSAVHAPAADAVSPPFEATYLAARCR